MKDNSEPTVNEYGEETHPAWAVIGASRGSYGGGGTNLFDSDITHQHTVTITIKQAGRKRRLHNDWVHGGKTLAEVELSEAQWASFVSAMNSGDGVPCTLRYTAEGGHTPNFPHVASLAETMRETHDAAEDAFADIREKFAAYNANRTAANRHSLQSAIENAVPNVDFAGKQLVEQAENVVAKAKSDVEAYVISKARQLGLEPGEIMGKRELTIDVDELLPPEDDD